ncbi:AAA family ATPase [Erythrobacter insulae]|uniref:AAA family ATPase n=1 Tax=Erythrobacter insulae TaxID=2584124 RepID=A0A547P9Y3_9SPHN|nr:AAA family ATPase [Erythrobacter insulae]TRD10907.1 AAA family ATPase [Erythrobacter insulae]
MDAQNSEPIDFAKAELGDTADAIAAAAIETLDWERLAKIEPSPKTFVIPKLAPAGELTLFTGAGSAGKSLLAQQFATALAGGVQTLGLDMGQAPAIYITCEDDEGQLHWRQKHLCKALGVSMENLAGKLEIASLRGDLDNALGTEGANGQFNPAPAYNRIAALLRRSGAKLLCLDNVAHLFTGNENDRGEVTRFVNALNRLAGESGAAILLLAHPNKAGDSWSGSTAWLNAVRSQITITHDLESDMRKLTVGKANYARKGSQMRFAWIDWAFVLEDDLPPDTARKLAETAHAHAGNETFLKCLTLCTERKRNVSHQPGSNYAPKIFAGMPEAKGFGKADFAAAMERLLTIGAIELDAELWRDEHRKPRRGIRLVESGA